MAASHRRILALLSFFAFLACGQALAQKPAGLPGGYPSKPVKVTIGAAPGGGTDILGRLVFGKLGEVWGSSFVLENMASGLGGVLALEATSKAPADGYTLLVTTGSSFLSAAFASQPTVDVRKAIAPIAQFTVACLIVAYNPSQPYNNLKEFIAYAKANPGKVNYGISGLGSSAHLSGELMQHMANFKMTAVPYKGAGQSVIDAVGGRIELVIGSVTALAPYVKSGKLKSLGITSGVRMPSVPDFHTLAESGIPGFDYAGWFGAVAPAGIPQPIALALNQGIQRVINLQDMQQTLLKGGSDPVTGSMEQFRATMLNSLEKTDIVLKATGLKLE